MGFCRRSQAPDRDLIDGERYAPINQGSRYSTDRVAAIACFAKRPNPIALSLVLTSAIGMILLTELCC